MQQETEARSFREEEEIEFDFKHIGGGELCANEVAELKDYTLSLGYRPWSIIFCGSDRDELVCIPNRDEARVVKNLTKNIGFPKMEKIVEWYEEVEHCSKLGLYKH